MSLHRSQEHKHVTLELTNRIKLDEISIRLSTVSLHGSQEHKHVTLELTNRIKLDEISIRLSTVSLHGSQEHKHVTLELTNRIKLDEISIRLSTVSLHGSQEHKHVTLELTNRIKLDEISIRLSTVSRHRSQEHKHVTLELTNRIKLDASSMKLDAISIRLERMNLSGHKHYTRTDELHQVQTGENESKRCHYTLGFCSSVRCIYGKTIENFERGSLDTECIHITIMNPKQKVATFKTLLMKLTQISGVPQGAYCVPYSGCTKACKLSNQDIERNTGTCKQRNGALLDPSSAENGRAVTEPPEWFLCHPRSYELLLEKQQLVSP
ncbi:hypothetical protein J6590_069650 [Homalodisca vitripennis]|nr:hypothetical protein J6590_069650 [Homalodisca vitripennis]